MVRAYQKHTAGATDFSRRNEDPVKELSPKRKAINEESRRIDLPTLQPGLRLKESAIGLKDFYAYSPTAQFIFRPTGDFWRATAIDQRLGDIGGIRASEWLMKNRAVEQVTWAPGKRELIQGELISEGGWFRRRGARCFNTYRAPKIRGGDPTDIEMWLGLISLLYPDDADHIISFLAHRVQRPGEKINHGLLLGGGQGIGKDTIIESVKFAVGHSNFADIGPQQLFEQFNPHAKSIILKINEAYDLGHLNRRAFYEHLKLYACSPPSVLLLNEKYQSPHYIQNTCGLIVTTNYADAIDLPLDDRRFYVAWSNVEAEMIERGYFPKLWNWLEERGMRNIAAFLKTYDLSNFDAKSPPTKTPAWERMVDASRPVEDAALADVLDKLGNPKALFIDQLISKATGAFKDLLLNPQQGRAVSTRIDGMGYVRVRRPGSTRDGYWILPGGRRPGYARKELSEADRVEAIDSLAVRLNEKSA